MTPNPECATVDTPIVDALHTMHDGKFLHIPVLDRGKIQIVRVMCFALSSNIRLIVYDNYWIPGCRWSCSCRCWCTSYHSCCCGHCKSSPYLLLIITIFCCLLYIFVGPAVAAVCFTQYSLLTRLEILLEWVMRPQPIWCKSFGILPWPWVPMMMTMSLGGYISIYAYVMDIKHQKFWLFFKFIRTYAL